LSVMSPPAPGYRRWPLPSSPRAAGSRPAATVIDGASGNENGELRHGDVVRANDMRAPW